MPSISQFDLKPYFSINVIKSAVSTGAINTITLIDKIYDYFDSQLTIRKIEQQNGSHSSLNFSFIVFIEEKDVSWMINNSLKDQVNHLLIICEYQDIFSIYFSDSTLKDKFNQYLVDNIAMFNLEYINEDILNYVFLNHSKVKTLWLYGIHKRTPIKADSKIISGIDLVNALDQLGDQSYAYSAIRANIVFRGKRVSIGYNPSKASIWIGPSDDWSDFINLQAELLRRISQTTQTNSAPIHTLSYPVNSFTSVNNPFDFMVIEKEALQSPSDRTNNLLDEIHSDYFYELNSNIHTSSEVTIKVFESSGNECGEIVISPNVQKSKVKFSTVLVSRPGKKGKLENFNRIFSYPDLIKIWYESGHVISDKKLFQSSYRDVGFDDFIWEDFSGFDITKEKPLDNLGNVLLNSIGLSGQNSLFCWVKKKWPKHLFNNIPYLSSSISNAWLICDDGANEKADFISVFDLNGQWHLTLIHVKAAKKCNILSQRQISVGAHDIVLSQAIKNIRYLDRTNLQTAIRNSVRTQTQIWQGRVKKQQVDFVNYFNQAPNNINIHVVVVQPHTRKTYYNSNSSLNSKHQLNTLLQNTKGVLNSMGATFHIIASDE